jgi:hypothetical protein
MRKFLGLSVAFFALSSVAFAADNASHTVTVDVAAVNEVAITGGNITLSPTGGTSTTPGTASDTTTCDLNWSTNESDKKITVETDLSVIRYPLSVLATSVTGGTAAAQVLLTDAPADFVTDISLTSGTSNLEYSVTAPYSAGVGTDVHVVTYTIVAG